MNSFLSVLVAAFLAMLKIFIISCVGIICAKYPKQDPLLNKDALRHFSRINTFVLAPALTVYSLGSTLTLTLFFQMSVLLPFCVIVVLVSYMLAFLLKSIHEDNKKLYISSSVSIGSPNGIALPIMVMASLCENSQVNEDYNGDSQKCFDEASSMMFIYIIPWFLIFWSYGYTMLGSIAKEDIIVHQQQSSNDKIKNMLKKLVLVFKNPALVGVYLGLFIGLTPYVSDLFFGESAFLRPFGGSIEVMN
jgi:predicted permease